MKVTTIPTEFLNLAKIEGIQELYATEYYLRRVNGRSYYDLVHHVKPDFDNNEMNSARALNRLWKNWKSSNLAGTITVGGEVVELTQTRATANVKAVKAEDTFLSHATNGLEKLIGKVAHVKAKKSTRKLGDVTIDVAGDFHVPFHDEASLNALLESDSDVLVLTGDFLDMLSASSHRQTCDFVTVQEELAVGRSVLEKLANKYVEIYVIMGNHDNRPIKKMQTLLPGLMPLMIHPMAWLTQGLDNVKFMSVTVPGTKPMLRFGKDYELDFVGLIEGCLFGHFENFCGDDAAKKVDVWLQQWNHILKLDMPKAVFQAHTHRLSMEFTPTGRLLVSTGCMCKPQEYQFLQHGRYSPPVQGYVKLFKDEEGNVDLNKTQLIATGAK